MSNKWKSIKTIPTDGTVVLTWTKGIGVQIAYCSIKTIDGNCIWSFNPKNYSKYYPSYWQHLPKSPYKKNSK